MKEIFKKFIPTKIYSILCSIYLTMVGYSTKSYSQEGEDMILKYIFSNKEKGFYVDIGAHHPKRFSNTYFFYKKGWKGINIDPMPGIMKKFNIERKRDINLEIGIAKKQCILNYNIFDETALNSFSTSLSTDRDKNTQYNIIEKKNIQVFPLSHILDTYIEKDFQIDFFSIDVEGLDLEVLESNNREKYRPKVIVIEILGFDRDKKDTCDIYIYLINKGYRLCSKLINSLLFITD